MMINNTAEIDQTPSPEKRRLQALMIRRDSNFRGISKMSKYLGVPRLVTGSISQDMADNDESEAFRLIKNRKKQATEQFIDSRMSDLRKMKAKVDPYRIDLTILPVECKEYIKELTVIPSVQYIRSVRTIMFKRKCYFKHLCKVLLLILKSVISRRKYFLDQWLIHYEYDPIEARHQNDLKRVQSMNAVYKSKSLLTSDVLYALQRTPLQRDEAVIKKIAWFLKRVRAFENFIPIEMIQELAKRVAYQKMEESRILAYEGQPALKAYHVISGRIEYVRKFQFKEGESFKLMGYLSKDQYTDPIEVETRQPRDYTMYSRGVTELLILDVHDLKVLRYSQYHLPVDFLRAQDIFRTYPVDALIEHRDSVVYKYFGPNQVISTDAVYSSFIYIVKSGNVNVVKKMRVFDPNGAGTVQSQVNPPSVEAIQASEKEENEPAEPESQRKTSILPILNKNQPMVDAELEQLYVDSYESWNSIELNKSMKQPSTPKLPPIKKGSLKIDKRPSMESPLSRLSNSRTPVQAKTSVYMSAKKEKSQLVKPSSGNQQDLVVESLQLLDDSGGQTKRNVAFKEAESDTSRIENVKLSNDIEKIGTTSDTDSMDSFTRLAFMIISILKKSDIFGLIHIDQDETLMVDRKETNRSRTSTNTTVSSMSSSEEDRSKIILISDEQGAEVILINKRYFSLCADVNTLLKIDKMKTSDFKYMTEKEMHQLHSSGDKWREFKREMISSVLKRSIA